MDGCRSRLSWDSCARSGEWGGDSLARITHGSDGTAAGRRAAGAAIAADRAASCAVSFQLWQRAAGGRSGGGGGGVSAGAGAAARFSGRDVEPGGGAVQAEQV